MSKAEDIRYLMMERRITPDYSFFIESVITDIEYVAKIKGLDYLKISRDSLEKINLACEFEENTDLSKRILARFREEGFLIERENGRLYSIQPDWNLLIRW